MTKELLAKANTLHATIDILKNFVGEDKRFYGIELKGDSEESIHIKHNERMFRKLKLIFQEELDLQKKELEAI